MSTGEGLTGTESAFAVIGADVHCANVAAKLFWCAYLVLAFVLAPAMFRAHCGRWPFAYPIRRPDAYLAIDFAYGAVTIGFTIWLIAASPGDGPFLAAGFVLGVLAVAIGAWAVVSLGPSWRLGQDRLDGNVLRVTTGPYRFIRHPIYLALIGLSVAMILLVGARLWTVAFAAATVFYAFLQGRNEQRFWDERGASRELRDVPVMPR